MYFDEQRIACWDVGLPSVEGRPDKGRVGMVALLRRRRPLTKKMARLCREHACVVCIVPFTKCRTQFEVYFRICYLLTAPVSLRHSLPDCLYERAKRDFAELFTEAKFEQNNFANRTTPEPRRFAIPEA
jgi:hypothetical protein